MEYISSFSNFGEKLSFLVKQNTDMKKVNCLFYVAVI